MQIQSTELVPVSSADELTCNKYYRPKTPAKEMVEEWFLASSDDFKGCEITPDASLVAYWTDIKISLFTNQSLSSREANAVAPAASREIEETGCIWGTIAVTRKYLVASTTGASFNVSHSFYY